MCLRTRFFECSKTCIFDFLYVMHFLFTLQVTGLKYCITSKLRLNHFWHSTNSNGWQMNQNLTLSWRGPLSYRNQSTDLQRKSMDWFLYDNSLRHERVKSYWQSRMQHIIWKFFRSAVLVSIPLYHAIVL